MSWLAVEAGRGIAQGIKEGMLDGKEGRVRDRALALFEEGGGTVKSRADVQFEARKAGLLWASQTKQLRWADEKYTKVYSSSLAGMLNSTTPIFTMFVGVLLYKSRSKLMNNIGLIIGLVGASGLIIKDFNSAVPI